MKNHVKLFEEFDRAEELQGFKLVKKLKTEEFMRMLVNNSLDRTKNYVYRLAGYTPNQKYSYQMSRWGFMTPVVTGNKLHVDADDNNMYNSPFIVYPKIGRMKQGYFLKQPDGTYKKYTGKSKKRLEECEMFDIAYFCGISFSAFYGNRSIAATEDEAYDMLVELINNVFDNEKRTQQWVQASRNYTPYIFEAVYVYEITDPYEAVDTILDECDATVSDLS